MNVVIRSSGNLASLASNASLTMSFGLPSGPDYRPHPGEQGEDLDDILSVFHAMKAKEVVAIPDPSVLKNTIYSTRNRGVIARWIVDVCAAFNLRSTTRNLAALIADWFTSRNLQTLPLNDCQLVAIAAIWISAKFEEMDSALPRVRQLSEVCDSVYTPEQILDMEERVLHALKWKISFTTPANFLYLYLHSLTRFTAVSKMAVAAPTAVLPASPVHDGMLHVRVIRVGRPDESGASEKTSTTVKIAVNEPIRTSLAVFRQKLDLLAEGISIYRLQGDDVVIAKRLDTRRTPAQLQLADMSCLYMCRADSSSIFSEDGGVTFLKGMNQALLKACDELLQECVLHVEFSATSPSVTAIAILVVARSLVGENVEESRFSIRSLCEAFTIPRDAVAYTSRILLHKYAKRVAAEGGATSGLKTTAGEMLEKFVS